MRTCDLDGRANVFAGPTDVAYLPARPGRHPALRARRPVRALRRPDRRGRCPLRYVPAAEVPVELRGAGQSSRQVRNFGTPDALEAGKIIACEVITPGGNWSSYPAHKHDRGHRDRVRAGGDLLLRDRRRPARRAGLRLHAHVVLARPRDRPPAKRCTTATRCSCPYGWHGPCVAAPGLRHVLPERDGRTRRRARLEDLRPPRPGLGARAPGRTKTSTPDSPHWRKDS